MQSDITSSLHEWKQTVISPLNEEINHQSTKLTTEDCKNPLKLKDEIIAQALKILNVKFVVVSIDKTSGNVVFV